MNEFLNLIGPHLKKHTNLQPSKVLFVEDHYEPSVLEDLLDCASVKPDLVITDFFATVPKTKYNIQYWPVWIAWFDKCKTPLLDLSSSNYEIRSTFNFMAFKARPYRVFALKVLEHFTLSTTQYVSNHVNTLHPLTYHAVIGNVLSEIVCSNNQELVQIIEFFKSPVTLPHKFFNEPRNAAYNNVADYNSFLKCQVFDQSAVSLILETIEPEWGDVSSLSEKTLFSVASKTMPIWLGGYQQANLWKSYGFDIFDDIVDHSYQYKSTNVERIFYAIKDNLNLLSDLQKTKQLHKTLTARFEKNVELLKGGVFLNQLNCCMNNYPYSIRHQINAIMDFQCYSIRRQPTQLSTVIEQNSLSNTLL